MRKPIAITSLLLAWLCANGALLDVVQVVAWSRMFADYNQTMSVGAALRATFDPEKPCELCMGVAEAKDLERKQGPQSLERTAEKLVLACEAPAKIVLTAPVLAWPAARACAAPDRCETVPVPPPRAAEAIQA